MPADNNLKNVLCLSGWGNINSLSKWTVYIPWERCYSRYQAHKHCTRLWRYKYGIIRKTFFFFVFWNVCPVPLSSNNHGLINWFVQQSFKNVFIKIIRSFQLSTATSLPGTQFFSWQTLWTGRSLYCTFHNLEGEKPPITFLIQTHTFAIFFPSCHV